MSGLGQRLLTSVIAVPILIALIGWAPWYGFSALVWLAITISFAELFAMVLVEETSTMRMFATSVGSVALGIMIATWQAPVKFQPFTSPQMLWVPFACLILVACVVVWTRGGAEVLSEVPKHITGMYFGIVYLAICGAHIAYLTRLPDGLATNRHGWVFLALVGTFSADTGGYFFGKFIGGPKLAPKVSPNKTWAGVLGCVVGGVGGAFAVRALLIPALQVMDCVLLGICIALLGQMGDLFVSLLKRAFGVKDTGAILPGHGGLLDRIDALLLTGPLIFYYATWVVLARPL